MFDVFISYARADLPATKTLAELLQKEGIRAWWDSELPVGEPFQAQINEKLLQSVTLIVLWSRHSARSRWVENEVEAALRNGKKVIPIRIDPELRLDEFPLGAQGLHFLDIPTSRLEADINQVLIAIGHNRVPGAVRVNLTKLPITGAALLGRETELGAMMQAWDSRATRVYSLIAMGGTGKTSLMRRWLDSLMLRHWAGADLVYGWSFYSQGTRHEGPVSADTFFADALRWLGYGGEIPGTPRDKAIKLAEMLDGRRSILVLDGLEPLQKLPLGGDRGRLKKDSGIAELLTQIAYGRNALCIVTSRQPVVELEGFPEPTVIKHDLSQLDEGTAIRLLQSLGVKGTVPDLRAAAKEYQCHALALTLLGNLLATMFGGAIASRSMVPPLAGDDEIGGHAFRVMKSYEQMFAVDSSRHMDLAILNMIGLFDRPAPKGAIDALRRTPPIAGLTDRYHALSSHQIGQLWTNACRRLRQLSLLNEEDPNAPGSLDAHPLVREYFGPKLQRSSPSAWKEAHQRLYEHYLAQSAEMPTSHAEMEPMFSAIAHACKAGRYEDAYLELFMERVNHGAQFLSKVLGLTGEELDILAHFFSERWNTVTDQIGVQYHGRILRDAGRALLACGSPEPAMQALGRAFEIRRKEGQLGSAAAIAVDIASASCALGRLEQAFKYASDALSYTQQINDRSQERLCRCVLGEVHHLAGRYGEAQRQFEQAEDIEGQFSPDSPTLKDLHGLRYWELLLDKGEANRVERRTKRVLREVGERESPAPIVLGGSNVALGQAHASIARRRRFANPERTFLFTADGATPTNAASIEPPRVSTDFQRAAEAADAPTTIAAPAREDNWTTEAERASRALNRAVQQFRDANNEVYLPRALLARAAHLIWMLPDRTQLQSHMEHPKADLNEVFQLSRRSNMRLFLADACLMWARMLLIGWPGSEQGREIASNCLAEGAALLRETVYKRREPDLLLLHAWLAAENGNRRQADSDLARASSIIGDNALQGYEAEHAVVSARCKSAP